MGVDGLTLKDLTVGGDLTLDDYEIGYGESGEVALMEIMTQEERLQLRRL